MARSFIRPLFKPLIPHKAFLINPDLIHTLEDNVGRRKALYDVNTLKCPELTGVRIQTCIASLAIL
jgi:hypothetical protein